MGSNWIVENSRVGLKAAAAAMDIATWVGRHLGYSVRFVHKHPSVISGCLLIGGTALYHENIMWYIRSSCLPRLMSRLIDWCSIKHHSGALRRSFRSFGITLQRETAGVHSHPTVARWRGSVNTAFDTFIVNGGYQVYSVSKSERDDFRGNDGCREFYNTKDVALKPQHDEIKSSHILKFVDVDMYCEMPMYLATGNTILMYTPSPERVGGSTTEGVYTFVDNKLQHTVNGGARYEHQIWDYDHDSLAVDFWWGTVVYKVEWARSADIHRVVGLFPERTIYGPLGWLLPGPRLRRRVVTYNATGFEWKNLFGIKSLTARVASINVSRFLQPEEDGRSTPMLSVNLAGELHSGTIPEHLLRAIQVRLATKATPLIADVERLLTAAKIEDAHLVAPLLFDLMPVLGSVLNMPILTAGAELADGIHYQTLHPLVHEDGKPTVRLMLDPLVTEGNVGPVKSFNNDNACVKGRVLDTRNKVRTWPSIYHQYTKEFLELLVPEELVHSTSPWDFDEVIARQNRPTQLSDLERDFVATAFAFIKSKVKSFQKGETYGKICPPRNISTLDADHRTRYSSFIYSLTERILKPQEWYAFGKTPKEIAARVHKIVSRSQWVVPTDFSSWDGTHSEQLVEFEIAIGRRLFAPRYHNEWVELVRRQYNAPAATAQGVFYNTVWSRLSGSSDTSSFNSIDNALIAYICLREHGHSIEAAWEQLGIYGGDDGLTPDVVVTTYNRIAERLGHKLKAERLDVGQPVPFLGRYYLDPWFSDRSMADFKRALTKLHLTTAPIQIPLPVALRRKAEGIWVTDSAAPVLSEWCQYVFSITEHVDTTDFVEALSQHTNYYARYDVAEQFPQYCVGDELMLAFAADQMHVSAYDIAQLAQLIDQARLGGPYPSYYFDLDQTITLAAVYQGEVRQIPGPVEAPVSIPIPIAHPVVIEHSDGERSEHGGDDTRSLVGSQSSRTGPVNNDGVSQGRIKNIRRPVRSPAREPRPVAGDHDLRPRRLVRSNNQGSATLARSAQPKPTGPRRGPAPHRV